MIHHLSIAARDPKMVSQFFAELTGGVSVVFPPNPGSYMAFAPDTHGTAVEVYPVGSLMLPNAEEGAIFSRGAAEPIARSPTHFAISVAHSAAEVTEMAQARGWDCFVCDRGGHFQVVEVWIENASLVEVLPPTFAADYLSFARTVVSLADPNTALSTHEPKAKTLQLA